MPEISVIMSIYKEPHDWICGAIDSVLKQTFTDFEFIIIDDAPDEERHHDLLADYLQKDERIHVIRNKVNIGLTKSLNKGLSIAKGQYIARMDADDISLPQRFSKQFDYMKKHPEVGVCGCFVRTFGLKEEEWRYPESYEKVFLFMCSPFAHPAVMIRKSVLVENGICYNENFRYSQDYDLWERLYPLTRFANLPDVLLRYRINDAQITRKCNAEQLKIASGIRRNAFNTYCRINCVDFQLGQFVELHTIKKYKELFFSRDFPFDTHEVLYYLYRSVCKDYGRIFAYFIGSGDCFRLPLAEGIKVVYCLLVGKKRHKVFAAIQR